MDSPRPDQAAWFAAEVLPHEAMLRGWLQGRFPARPDLDDIVQEAFARVLRAHAEGTVICPRALLFVAQAGYHVPGDEASPAIRSAQAVLGPDATALEGPDTVQFKGNLRERIGQGVHLSRAGLVRHGEDWAERIIRGSDSKRLRGKNPAASARINTLSYVPPAHLASTSPRGVEWSATGSVTLPSPKSGEHSPINVSVRAVSAR